MADTKKMGYAMSSDESKSHAGVRTRDIYRKQHGIVKERPTEMQDGPKKSGLNNQVDSDEADSESGPGTDVDEDQGKSVQAKRRKLASDVQNARGKASKNPNKPKTVKNQHVVRPSGKYEI